MENNAFIDFKEKIEDIRERYGLWISNKGSLKGRIFF